MGLHGTSMLFSGYFFNSTTAVGYYVYVSIFGLVILLGLFRPLRAGQYRVALYIFVRGRRTERAGQVDVAQVNFRPGSSWARSAKPSRAGTHNAYFC